MKCLTVRSCAITATSALVLATALRLSAQTPAPAAAPTEESDSTIILSPFVVTGDEDSGYAAKDTLAGTRIRTELKDVGSSIQVVTQKFLKDTNSKNASELLVYTTGTEVAAQGGNFLGQGDGPFVTNTSNSPVANTRVRGLAEADNTRDFFLSDIPWDSYNVGRVDLQRGPNSVLFGIGSPAGIVNSTLNGASFKNGNKVEAQFGSFGSWRLTGDFNRVLVKNVLAVRVSLLDDQTKYRQDPAFRDDKRIFAAVKWAPAGLNKGSARTEIRANIESGKVNSNMPRYTPPIDTITPWFSNLNKATYDGRTLDNGNPSAFIGPIGNRVYDGFVTTYEANGTQGITYPTANKQNNGTQDGPGPNVIKGIATTDRYAIQANLPAAASGMWKAASLTDRGAFDYINNLFEGPNKSEFNKFKAWNAAFQQTFLDNKLGVELTYDWQNARWGNDSIMSNDGTTLTVDINTIRLDGRSNSAYVARPMIVLGGGSASAYRAEQTRKSFRATGFAELNFNDISGKDSMLAKIFGRNTFTALFSEQKKEFQDQAGPRWYTPNTFSGNSGSDSVVQASRDIIKLVYVGGSLSGASNASGIGFKGLKSKIKAGPTTVLGLYRNIDANNGQFVDVPLTPYDSDNYSDDKKTYSKGYRALDIVQSTAIIAQGYWFDGTIIPMVGYRRDTDKFIASSAKGLTGTNAESGAVDITDNGFDLTGASSRSSGNSLTKSLVTHLPKSMRAKMPGNMDVSLFYNVSSNFKPESRRDVRGHALDNPKGKTKEYGFAISALDDKLSFKAVHFKTEVKNASLGQALANNYLIGAVEWWGGNAARAQFDGSNWQAGNYGTATNGRQVTWQPDATTVNPGQAIFQADGVTYTQAALDQTRTNIDAAITDWWAKLAPADLQNAWEFVSNQSGTGVKDGNYSPSAMTVTGTTLSKGWEFEVTTNPIKGLDVSFNASKTSAQRSELADSYGGWIKQRWKDLQGPMGNIRIWGGASGGETTRSKFGAETYAGYLLFNALQGTDVPELHQWRYNLVTNYAFQNEGLKGVNAGFSYRWSDANTIGFIAKSSIDPITNNPIYVADLTKPVKGKSEGIMDFWVGYTRKLNHNVQWRIQANVRNAFANSSLIPTTVQPTGAVATYRIPEPRTYSITNTLEF